jgi:hypothetical protein
MEFTQRVAIKLKIQTKDVELEGRHYQLPHDANDKYIVLYPRDILRKLPAALDW